jgi:hypothetical protein
MQSLVRTNATAVSNPLFGNRLSYRMVAAPAPSTQATRQVVTMAKKKGVRIIVTMECTEARGEGLTPSRYTTQKVRGCRCSCPPCCCERHSGCASRQAATTFAFCVTYLPHGAGQAD